MERMNCVMRSEALALPVSTKSWIILRHYARHHADLDVYKKIITDYRRECPLFELEDLLTTAREVLPADEFRQLIEFLFDQHHALPADSREL